MIVALLILLALATMVLMWVLKRERQHPMYREMVITRKPEPVEYPISDITPRVIVPVTDGEQLTLWEEFDQTELFDQEALEPESVPVKPALQVCPTCGKSFKRVAQHISMKHDKEKSDVES